MVIHLNLIYIIVENEKASVRQAQLAVMRKKSTADCAQFLVQNEIHINTSHSSQNLKNVAKNTFFCELTISLKIDHMMHKIKYFYHKPYFWLFIIILHCILH